jgi:predicted methyltransferase
LLEPGPHPFGEIIGLDPSLAVQPDTPDLHYPLDKLWRMAGAARDVSRKPDEVMALLRLEEGDVVADVGAGSGYHTWHLSRAVGASGEVWASEILLDSLEFMKLRMAEEPPPHANIHLLLHDRRDLLLPEDSIKLALLVNVHFFAYPVGPPMKDQGLDDVVRFYRSIHRALEPGGRMVILEHIADFERKPQGSITDVQIAEQLSQAGFVLKEQHQLISGEYFLVFAAE